MGDVTSYFAYPSATGIGLALLFGLVWLAPLTLPWWKNRWAWLAFIGGALAFAPAIAWVQIPLQTWTGKLLTHLFSQDILQRYILLFGIPQVLLSGVVQEAFKLAPPLIYLRLQKDRNKPKTALAIGAISGAGFGIFEAQWLLNQVFTLGWTWQTVQLLGWQALLPFGERFFTVAFHTATTALAAYGVSRRRGWLSYLLVAFVHSLTNYGILFAQTGLVTTIQLELYVVFWAVSTMSIAHWLRWRRLPETQGSD